MITDTVRSARAGSAPVAAACSAAALLCASLAVGAEELTVASFVSPQHPMSKWIDAWAEDLAARSDGELSFRVLHGAQMGPPPKYYDLAAKGQVDVAWVLHGATPGRFELTEISNMPFLFCSAEQATAVLNDARLRDEYLDPEHRGVRVLMDFMHPPGQVNLAKGDVETAADLQGLAIRPASRSVGDYITALGGKPVGLPPTAMAEALQKGTIDGTFIDYGGAALAYQLGPYLESVSEVYAYTSSFALVMNPRTYDGLSEKSQGLIDESFEGKEAEIGQLWDGVDSVGKQALVDQGVRINVVEGEALETFRSVGESVTEDYVSALDADGKPGTEVLALMRTLIDEVGPVGCDR